MKHHWQADWWRADAVAESARQPERIGVREPTLQGGAVPFWGLLTFTFVLLIAPQTFFPALAPLRIALLVGAGAIVTQMVQRLVSRQPVVRLTPEMWIAACLVGWAVVTLPLSYWPGGGVRFLFEMYFKTLAIFWLASTTINTLARLRQVEWELSLLAVPIAISGMMHYLSSAFIPGAAVTRIVGYGSAYVENPNDMALMLNLILPLSLSLVLTTRNAVGRGCLLVFIVLDVLAIILTFSRGGFVTLAMTFVMYAWRLRKRPEMRWVPAALAVGVVCCVPFIPSGYIARLATVTDINSDPTGSAQSRWRDMLAAAGFVLSNPIVGAGIGMDELALNEARGAFWVEVHNVYLQYAVELGIPGLVLFLMLLRRCFKSVRLVEQRSSQVPALQEFFLLAEGIELSLFAFAVAALFHPFAYHFYFFYMGGLAISIRVAYDAEATRIAPERDRV